MTMNDHFKASVHGTGIEKNGFAQQLRVRDHVFTSDVGPATGGTDSAPDPHDYFDAALAACKAQTAIWYARRHDIPLENVDTTVERDSSDERKGTYRLRVRVAFRGPLSEEQRVALDKAVAACPIHKLMTRVDIEIETAARES